MSYRHNKANREQYTKRRRVRRARGEDTAWALRRAELQRRGKIHSLGTSAWHGGRIQRRMERAALRIRIMGEKSPIKRERLKEQLEVLYR